MSSTIKLYEHNQKAYDALLDMLGECDRACVIKPTGTGKFVILAKMVQDNPDKRFLLLGTNDYMFNDQMANLAEIAPGFTPENLQFMTYSAAMMTARRGEKRSEKFLAFKVCFYDTLVPTREYKSGYAADRFARKCAAQGLWCSLHGLAVADGSCEWVEISAC